MFTWWSQSDLASVKSLVININTPHSLHFNNQVCIRLKEPRANNYGCMWEVLQTKSFLCVNLCCLLYAFPSNWYKRWGRVDESEGKLRSTTVVFEKKKFYLRGIIVTHCKKYSRHVTTLEEPWKSHVTSEKITSIGVNTRILQQNLC